jgi:hypothetical protein
VVADARRSAISARLNHHEVEPQREARKTLTTRQSANLDQRIGRTPEVRSLAMIDGLLGESEVAARAPAHLDDDEEGGGTRVDRHEIELVATDMDVPGQDGPAALGQQDGDQLFGGITRLLGRRSCPSSGWTSHPTIVAEGSSPALNRGLAAAFLGP